MLKELANDAVTAVALFVCTVAVIAVLLMSSKPTCFGSLLVFRKLDYNAGTHFYLARNLAPFCLARILVAKPAR